MTMCICFKCGAMKWGAFNPCDTCGVGPQGEEELAVSLAMSDHYFDPPTLEAMGRAVAAGQPPRLDPAMREALIDDLRNLLSPEESPQMPDALAPSIQQKPAKDDHSSEQ